MDSCCTCVLKILDHLREIQMTVIERMFNDNMALRNIYDADPLRHNDDEYRHQIVILV